MDMELGLGAKEQVVGLSNNDATHIIAKGKRTKRLRLLSPCGVAAATVMTSSCSSASGDRDSGGGDGGGGADYGSFSSTTSTYESTDQEEEDMANCLILLAQGKGGGGYDDDDDDDHHHHKQKQQVEDHDHHGDGNKTEKGSTSSRKFAEMATATVTATATATKVGFYIYECKTCNRTFPSFQALGGHRASHKKPKVTAAEEKKLPPPAPLPQPPQPPFSQPQLVANYDQLIEEAGQAHIKSGPPISLQLGSHGHRAFHGNKVTKIHECSICGSEFTSGQALGGHMRRHRASTNATSTQVVGMMSSTETISCNATAAEASAVAVEVEVRPRNILELDLNLPAPPEDDLRESKFQFTAASQRSMVLSAAPALVDCHY